MTSQAAVQAVVVNFNGGDLTMDCILSLQATEWPAGRFRVVLVDNDSHDGVVDRVRADLPDVVVLPATTNLGFGGGCNLALRGRRDAELVALVNPDATVDPQWLAPLVAALDEDVTVGAACPKILFAHSYLDLWIESQTTVRGYADHRQLGVRYSGLRADGVEVTRHGQPVSGFWGIEQGSGTEKVGQWTAGRAHLRVPVMRDRPRPSVAALQLAADVRTRAVLRTSAGACEIAVGQRPQWFDVALGGEPYDVINSVGSLLTKGSDGADRGYLERDVGQYEDAVDVPAWSGAAVLLANPYLDDVGLFDERYFLYYEDFDLAWRGRARGWRYRYEPGSVVRHVHSASTDETSVLVTFYNERNRLLTLARNASPSHTGGAAVRSLLVTASYARRDILSPLLRGRRPRGASVWVRLRAFLSFLHLLPGTVVRRQGS